MNKNLIDAVESLGGTALMGGILIQFSDAAFEQALKKMYEAGVEAEREACAKAIEECTWPKWADATDARDVFAEAIRARGNV
jgi:hypothetical protein